VTDIDDGSRHPEGYETPDGELRVVGGQFTETELGRHQRWMRQAPDLLEKYEALLSDFRASQPEEQPAAIDIIKAKAAVTTLRDAARAGGLDFRQRDPLVVLLHRALDALGSRQRLASQPEGWQPQHNIATCACMSCSVARANLQPEGWQPIASAPKDGTPIVLGAQGEKSTLGFWSQREQHWLKLGAQRPTILWPTHYWPLPPPPAGEPTP
jgi:hypothetical protein